MSDLILHHYWQSPYADKIRRIMGFKGLEWKSVIIPMIMPKPDLTVLTAGYRKTPVLQIGADIYCDSDLIARTIDRLYPDPPLFAGNNEALTLMLGPWQQDLFFLCVRVAGATAPIFPPGFLEDRATMVEVPLTREKSIKDAPALKEQLRAKLTLLDAHLASRRFVLGDAPSLADFSFHHPVNALNLIPQTQPMLVPYANVRAWMERVEAFGFGNLTEIESSEAVEAAKNATPAAAGSVDPDEPNGLKAGDTVTIVHESFGNDPVEGELVSSSVHEIAVRHRNDRVGEVVIHLPREHYKVYRA
jgi:glutathione S-transferase